MPQESGGRTARNQPYTLLSIAGDAVFLEFLSATGAADASADLFPPPPASVEVSGVSAATGGM